MKRTPWVRMSVIVAGLTAFHLGCCDDCEDSICPDTTPPTAVTDLVVASVTDSAATLVWTTPGDDGDQGIAAGYDLRFSNEEYSGAGWWDSLAVAVEVPPVPKAAGWADSYTVGGLTPATTYFFALKTADEVPNWSGLSSVAGYTLGSPILEVLPAALQFGMTETELTLTIANLGIGTLTWTILPNQDWLNIVPSSGSTTTEEDEITVSVDRSGLTAGTYMDSATVTPNVGAAQQIPISLLVATTQQGGMVLVPAGTFIMGDGVAVCGQGEREVTLSRSFYLGQHEVTNQEYLDALQWAYDQGHVNVRTGLYGDYIVSDNLDEGYQTLLDLNDDNSEIQFDGSGTFYLSESPSEQAQGAYPGGYDASGHPVKEVTWFGAAAYCDWLSMQAGLPPAYEHTVAFWPCNEGEPYSAQGYRLPTDAEWEYAARFDDGRIYPWGDQVPDCTRANICVGWSSPVGSYAQAPEVLILADMSGNVWEWCNDLWACELGTDPVIDPPGPDTGIYCVCRGGSWGTQGSSLRCATRGSGPWTYGYGSVGFRIARTAGP